MDVKLFQRLFSLSIIGILAVGWRTCSKLELPTKFWVRLTTFSASWTGTVISWIFFPLLLLFIRWLKNTQLLSSARSIAVGTLSRQLTIRFFDLMVSHDAFNRPGRAAFKLIKRRLPCLAKSRICFSCLNSSPQSQSFKVLLTQSILLLAHEILVFRYQISDQIYTLRMRYEASSS